MTAAATPVRVDWTDGEVEVLLDDGWVVRGCEAGTTAAQGGRLSAHGHGYRDLAVGVGTRSVVSEDETMSRLEQVTIGEMEHNAVVLADPDPGWPEQFAVVAAEITAALGSDSELHHVGSTAVADLPAKPTLDIVLVVDDPADELAYVPALESIGFELRVREPDWYEHRLLRRPTRTVHLHVFGPGSPEVARMLRFRDRLRTDPEARTRYAQVKQQLAARDWPTVQHYANAKTEIIQAILEDDLDEDDAAPL